MATKLNQNEWAADAPAARSWLGLSWSEIAYWSRVLAERERKAALDALCRKLDSLVR